MVKSVSSIASLIRVLATVFFVVAIIIFLDFGEKMEMNQGVLFLCLLGLLLGYCLLLGFAQIVQSLQELVYLKKNE